MSTNAISSHGTILKKGDHGSPESFVAIAEVGDIKGPQIKGSREDATHHGSGGWEDKIATLKSGGKVTFDLNYLSGDVTHNESTGLLKAALDQSKENFQLIFPDTSGFAFSAFVDMDFEAKVKGKLKSSIELEITGPVVPL